MDVLTTLFTHHRWANLQILEACLGLTDEQLEATLVGTYGSIRDTLQHIVMAEQSYFSRISTGQSYRRSKDLPRPTIAEMTEMAQVSGSGLIEWASKVGTEDTVSVDWEGTPRDVPKTILLTQAINHATEHRSQVMALLTHVGIQPPDLSGWEFFDELE